MSTAQSDLSEVEQFAVRELLKLSLRCGAMPPKGTTVSIVRERGIFADVFGFYVDCGRALTFHRYELSNPDQCLLLANNVTETMLHRFPPNPCSSGPVCERATTTAVTQ